MKGLIIFCFFLLAFILDMTFEPIMLDSKVDVIICFLLFLAGIITGLNASKESMGYKFFAKIGLAKKEGF